MKNFAFQSRTWQHEVFTCTGNSETRPRYKQYAGSIKRPNLHNHHSHGPPSQLIILKVTMQTFLKAIDLFNFNPIECEACGAQQTEDLSKSKLNIE